MRVRSKCTRQLLDSHQYPSQSILILGSIVNKNKVIKWILEKFSLSREIKDKAIFHYDKKKSFNLIFQLS